MVLFVYVLESIFVLFEPYVRFHILFLSSGDRVAAYSEIAAHSADDILLSINTLLSVSSFMV